MLAIEFQGHTMSRKQYLENAIDESYGIIQEYEDIIRVGNRPEEKARARAKIQEQWELIGGYLTEYCALVDGGLPPAIREIARAAKSRDWLPTPALPPDIGDSPSGLKRVFRRIASSRRLLISTIILLIGLCLTFAVIGRVASQYLPDLPDRVAKALSSIAGPFGPTLTLTPMPGPTSTLALTPTPTSTPMAFPTAIEGHPIVIVADFDDRSEGKHKGKDPAQYVYEELQKLANKLEIDVKRLYEPVDDNSADTVCTAYNATLVLWGWYDELSITTRIERNKSLSKRVSTEERRHLSMSDREEIEFRILFDVPSHATYLALFTFGITEYELARYDPALEYFGSALAAIPEGDGFSTVPTEAYFYRGNIYYLKQMYDMALQDYTEAIKLDPELYVAYNNRGVLYYRQKEFRLALADYSKAIELAPTYAIAYFHRGILYGNEGQYNAALADYTRAIELDPESARTYYNRAIINEQIERSDAALSDYTSAIELDPQYFEAYYNRAAVHYQQKEYASALADASRAVELRPDNAEACYVRGLTHKELGQIESAIADLERCLELADDPQLRQLAEQQLRELHQR
jgi:tetratricopeptide (TPR) repeat protein